MVASWFCRSLVSVSMRRALGPAAGGGVDQHGFADPGELVQEFTYGQVQPVAVGLQAHQVRDLQGEHAGEGVHPDVVLGPVEHRREGDDVGGFHLPEGAFGFGLGSVAGDHVDDRPVVVVGDDHVFAEDLGFQPGTGVGVDVPAQAGGLWAAGSVLHQRPP